MLTVDIFVVGSQHGDLPNASTHFTGGHASIGDGKVVAVSGKVEFVDRGNGFGHKIDGRIVLAAHGCRQVVGQRTKFPHEGIQAWWVEPQSENSLARDSKLGGKMGDSFVDK